MVSNLTGTYEERLYYLRLPTLEERRVRGDLIETYKIFTGKSNVNLDSWFTLAEEIDGRACTRAMSGFLNILPPPAPQLDLRRNFFSHRVVPLWNGLPDSIKIAPSTDMFKAAYDSYKGF